MDEKSVLSMIGRGIFGWIGRIIDGLIDFFDIFHFSDTSTNHIRMYTDLEVAKRQLGVH